MPFTPRQSLKPMVLMRYVCVLWGVCVCAVCVCVCVCLPVCACLPVWIYVSVRVFVCLRMYVWGDRGDTCMHVRVQIYSCIHALSTLARNVSVFLLTLFYLISYSRTGIIRINRAFSPFASTVCFFSFSKGGHWRKLLQDHRGYVICVSPHGHAGQRPATTPAGNCGEKTHLPTTLA